MVDAGSPPTCDGGLVASIMWTRPNLGDAASSTETATTESTRLGNPLDPPAIRLQRLDADLAEEIAEIDLARGSAQHATCNGWTFWRCLDPSDGQLT